LGPVVEVEKLENVVVAVRSTGETIHRLVCGSS